MMLALLLTAALAAADTSLAAARDLYASAAYEDALAVLNSLPPNRPADEIRASEQYRALCLLALGRPAEAEAAIAAVINGDPTYRPSSDVSPRVRAAFTEVRRKMMPVIIQHWYAQAKEQFDRKEYAAASGLFTQLLAVMADPEIQQAASQPPLSDLRTLASGFRDLAANAIAPPAPAPLPASDTPPAAVAAEPTPSRPRVYTSSDGDVVPPTVIRQELPAFPGTTLIGKRGVIEVVVNENGDVETASIRQPVTPQYDKLALAAARNWRYQPATVYGAPVKYRKTIQITVAPARTKD